MDAHIVDIFHTLGTIGTVCLFLWRTRVGISKEIDDKLDAFESRLDKRFDAIDQRFDALEERMVRMEQNHLNHISQLHALPVVPYTQEQGSEQDD